MKDGSATLSKRRWLRLRRRFKVTLKQSAAFTVDVCSGGFCALLLRALPPGTPVEGTILIGGRALAYTGNVVWARAGDVRLGLRGRIGVGFVSADALLPALLREDTAEATAGRSMRLEATGTD
jgi:hypothetical protein